MGEEKLEKNTTRGRKSEPAGILRDGPLGAIIRDMPRNVAVSTTGMAYDRERKYVTWDFGWKKFDSIELLHMTDLQFGHRECRVHRVLEYRDWVLAEPNRFMLW